MNKEKTSAEIIGIALAKLIIESRNNPIREINTYMYDLITGEEIKPVPTRPGYL